MSPLVVDELRPIARAVQRQGRGRQGGVFGGRMGGLLVYGANISFDVARIICPFADPGREIPEPGLPCARARRPPASAHPLVLSLRSGGYRSSCSGRRPQPPGDGPAPVSRRGAAPRPPGGRPGAARRDARAAIRAAGRFGNLDPDTGGPRTSLELLREGGVRAVCSVGYSHFDEAMYSPLWHLREARNRGRRTTGLRRGRAPWPGCTASSTWSSAMSSAAAGGRRSYGALGSSIARWTPACSPWSTASRAPSTWGPTRRASTPRWPR